MQTNTTDAAQKEIAAALRSIHSKMFENSGCATAKRRAQIELKGRTHYVDEETLQWHKSRVVAAGPILGGLFYRIVTSDALDMHNTKRGFRAVVFDVFGTVINRCDLEHASRTSAAAFKASEAETIDIAAHYAEAITGQIKHAELDAELRRAALRLIVEVTL